MDFKQSQTYLNLITSYEKELLQIAKCLVYVDIANKEGFIEIGNIYNTTARNSKAHARTWLRNINEGNLPVTTENLSESAASELFMANKMYPEFMETALKEGYNDIAALFSGIANIDFNHSSRFDILYKDVINNEFFCKPESTLWICMECGNVLSGNCSPKICPICGFPQGYYRLFDEAIMY